MRRVTATVFGLFGVLLVIGTGCDTTDTTAVNTQYVQVDGKTFNEKFTCNESFDGPSTAPTSPQGPGPVHLVSGTTYEVRDVPDTGFRVHRKLQPGWSSTCTATSPDGYTAAGLWTFGTSGNSFSGSST